MEEHNEKRTWQPMDVEEAGHVGEVLQGVKVISPSSGRNDDEVNPDILEL